MNKLLLIATFTFLSVFASAQGLEDVIVEKYYISDANDATDTRGGYLAPGSVTYRIYVDMLPGYILQSVYASPDNLHELRFETSTLFFNNGDRGETTANGIADSRLSNNTVMVDSWLSMGAVSAGQVGILKADDTNGAIANLNGFLKNADPLAGIPIKTKDGIIPGAVSQVTLQNLEPAIGVFGSENAGPLFLVTDGTWYNLPGTAGPTIDNRVLIAQITTDGVFSFKLNFQIRGSDDKIYNYVHSNPKGKEILCTKCNFNSSSVGVNEMQVNKPEFRLFPNPANDYINLSFAGGNQEVNYSYSILNMIGKTVIESEDIIESVGFTNEIDISSLPRGAYIVRVRTKSGLLLSKMFIKNQ